jgi:hypothetical protein
VLPLLLCTVNGCPPRVTTVAVFLFEPLRLVPLISNVCGEVATTSTFKTTGCDVCARISPEQKANIAIKKVKDGKNFVFISYLLKGFCYKNLFKI